MSTIWQNAPAIWLENGFYEGLTTVAELKQHGDLGIGAFDHLDGEMIGVDGVFYRITGDAVAHVAADSDTLPFCMVTTFRRAGIYTLPLDMTADGMTPFMDDKLGSNNSFYSLRLDGVFQNVRTRCFPKQSKPFVPLAEVMKTQPEFFYERLEGTLVGFRHPSYVGHMTPPGDHFHLISADRTFGGHVMSFEGAEATLAVDRIERHEMTYPDTPDFAETKLD